MHFDSSYMKLSLNVKFKDQNCHVDSYKIKFSPKVNFKD